jgi:predicted metal-dependent hydrolase
MPRWGVRREARAFVEASRSWIARQRARHSERRDTGAASAVGGTVLVDGVAARIGLTETGEISIARDEAVIATLDAAGSVSAAVERWLRARASVELPAMLKALAAEHQISVTRVSVRNQRSRWGACSPSGTITLNWRLIQAPSFVREYVLLHELMHRREMNHSRRFWRLVAACCPRHAEARQWLRKEGKQLWSDSPSSSRR